MAEIAFERTVDQQVAYADNSASDNGRIHVLLKDDIAFEQFFKRIRQLVYILLGNRLAGGQPGRNYAQLLAI